ALSPANIEAPPPAPEQILRAAWLHRRRLRSGSVQDDAEDGAVGVRIDHAPQLDRVSLIEERPLAVYVTTVVYRPADAVEGESWVVADPFVPGASRRLTRCLAERLPGSPELREFLEQMLGTPAAPAHMEVAEFLDRLGREAAWAVGSKLALALPREG